MGIKDAPPKDLTLDLTGRTLADVPVPHGREEEWRFTPLRRLVGLHEALPATGSVEVKADAAGPHVHLASADVDTTGFAPADRIAVAAAELAPQSLVIDIDGDVVIEEPVTISLRGEPGTSYSHALVRVGAHAKATIVVDVTGSGALAANLHLKAGEGANVTLVQIADGDRDQVLAGQHTLQLGRDASVQHVVVTLGGDVVRLVTHVGYEGPGGRAEALGVFFTDSGQHHEHRLFVDHSVPNCGSDVQYKGALQGDDAHAVWIGDVLIRAAATGTETYEMNRNLVLTEGARADSVPNLEIETGNVTSAGHASATGRFDEEQLFYLLSRGIPVVEAKRLVVRGFINDLVQRIPVPELRERLLSRVELRLGAHDPRFDFDEVEA